LYYANSILQRLSLRQGAAVPQPAPCSTAHLCVSSSRSALPPAPARLWRTPEAARQQQQQQHRAPLASLPGACCQRPGGPASPEGTNPAGLPLSAPAPASISARAAPSSAQPSPTPPRPGPGGSRQQRLLQQIVSLYSQCLAHAAAGLGSWPRRHAGCAIGRELRLLAAAGLPQPSVVACVRRRQCPLTGQPVGTWAQRHAWAAAGHLIKRL
jgi:hypothetical protein